MFNTNLAEEQHNKVVQYFGARRDVFKDSKLVESIDTREADMESIKHHYELKVQCNQRILQHAPLNKQLNDPDNYRPIVKTILEHYEIAKSRVYA